MIGIGYCTKQSDKKIDDSNYINNMLMPGNSKFLFIFHYYRLTSISYLLGQENESWGCGYHGDNGYSFCSGSGEPYDLPRHEYTDEYTAGYTTGDIIGCYLNFKSN